MSHDPCAGTGADVPHRPGSQEKRRSTPSTASTWTSPRVRWSGSWPERRRQDHDAADADDAAETDRRHRHGRRVRRGGRAGPGAAQHRLRLPGRLRVLRRRTPATRWSTTGCSTGCRARPRRPAGQELFEQLQLEGLWTRMPKNMSGGQKRRLDVVDGPDPRPDAGLPRRAHHRAGPAGAGQPLGAHRGPALPQRRHGLPDHALPRRGGRARGPDPDHRPGPDRRLRHRRQPQGAGGRATCVDLEVADRRPGRRGRRAARPRSPTGSRSTAAT